MNTVAKQPWFKDLGYYVIWFVFWGAVLSFLQPVTSASFWAVKVQHALLGAGFGAACAIAFSLLQNGLNISRRKWLSWVLAIACWIGVGLVLAFATGSFA